MSSQSRMVSIAFAATPSTSLTVNELNYSFNTTKPFCFTFTKTVSLYPLVLQSKSLTVVSVANKPNKGKTRSRRYLDIQKYVDIEKEYDVKTAVSLLKQTASTKFVESAEAHFRLNINPKYDDQQLRTTVNLPKGTGSKTVRIAVLAEGEDFDEAKSAGADIVGGEDLIAQIKEGIIDFDKLIIRNNMKSDEGSLFSRNAGTLGKLLGRRRLMPSPKAGTVTDNLTQAIEDFRTGKVELRVDKDGIVHIPFGKVDFSEEDLIVNFNAAVKSVEMNRPTGVKGVYWTSAHICSTMGPSIRLNLRNMLKSLGYTLS